MKIIRPFTVSDVSLVSSTVSATDPSALGSWAVGTTYALGDIVQVDSPSVAFTASGATLTAAAHGFADDTPLKVTTTGTLPAGLTADTLYYMVNVATNTFKLSTKKGGAPIITTSAGAGAHTATISTHKLYESLAAGNVGNTPHKSTTQWLDLGSTNRWKLFDQSITSQAENADSMTYVIQTSGRIDSVALLNLSAASVTITGETLADGVVYGPTTYSLVSSVEVTSYWSWFFDRIERKASFIDVDFPPYNDLKVTITITDTGNTVKCGGIVAGLSKKIGGTQYGASLGIQDYSVKTRDDFGNYSVLERAFSKRGSFQVVVDRVSVDGVVNLLEQHRATPAVYVGADGYDSAIIYGYYRDFTVGIQYPTYSLCNIEIEGLT